MGRTAAHRSSKYRSRPTSTSPSSSPAATPLTRRDAGDEPLLSLPVPFRRSSVGSGHSARAGHRDTALRWSSAFAAPSADLSFLPLLAALLYCTGPICFNALTMHPCRLFAAPAEVLCRVKSRPWVAPVAG